MHLFVDNLTNIDFSYLDSQRGLVGETWLASITLDGALDEQGMVCDFGVVKKTVRQWLDTYVDHCLVVAKNASALSYSQTPHELSLQWQYGKGFTLHCTSPHQAISLVDDAHAITPESVAAWCIEQLRPLLPETIDKIQLQFVPESIAHAHYHYSHGLKKHRGNCQRIAHGHRSTIEITQDQQRNHDLEYQWAKMWQDIYIGTREDLCNTSTKDNCEYYHFAYESEQGHFELSLPASHCYLIDTDSTVEFIAQHIAHTLQAQHPNSELVVRAYEGIGKGAIAFGRQPPAP